jgi:hypothetical protein
MSAIAIELARSGVLSASELYSRVKGDFGSESSFHRALRATPNVQTFGATRSRAYALRRPDLAPVSLFMRSERGTDYGIGQLVALEANQWALDTRYTNHHAMPSWLAFGQLSEALPVYQGLPWFMEPFRPAGFLGRAWVNEHAAANGWPVDAETWTDDQVLQAALQAPWDWRGNLSVGPFAAASRDLVPIDQRLDAYTRFAELVLSGEPAGSSADGEQPKFTAILDEGHSERAVLVKFSPRMSEGAAARRWGDMLVTETVAAQTLTLHGMSAASTEVFSHDDRVWLESTRFDRIGMHGRRGMASLRSLATSFGYNGARHGWVGAVHHLQRKGVIDMDQLMMTRRLADICHLIHDTDMHMGNLSFLLPSDREVPMLTVAPAYDLSPMRWSPTSGRPVPALDKNEGIVRIDDPEAMAIAQEIWATTAEHPFVSDEWRELAEDRAMKIGNMRKQATLEDSDADNTPSFG